jgi:hypothetical protein
MQNVSFITQTWSPDFVTLIKDVMKVLEDDHPRKVSFSVPVVVGVQ